MANQYSKNPSLSKKLQAYAFVAENPGCTARQVAEAIGIQMKTASVNLTRLSHAGMVSGYRIEGETHIRWDVTPDDHDDFEPVRIVRQQWAPHHHRDPLDAAFFGPAQRMAA